MQKTPKAEAMGDTSQKSLTISQGIKSLQPTPADPDNKNQTNECYQAIPTRCRQRPRRLLCYKVDFQSIVAFNKDKVGC